VDINGVRERLLSEVRSTNTKAYFTFGILA
jgi:hypothetical protein